MAGPAFSSQRCRGSNRDDHVYGNGYQLSYEPVQFADRSSARPARVDREIVALHVAEVAQALQERLSTVWLGGGAPTCQIADPWHFQGCLWLPRPPPTPRE